MRIIRLPFTPKVTKLERMDAYPSFQAEDYWVGSGFYGQRGSASRPTPKLRRFLRVRDADGICSYFFWTNPRRGERVPRVVGFRKRVKITKELAARHYKK